MKKSAVFIFVMAFFSLQIFARPKVALVLSGGAAYGLAEIPLLEAIEDEGIPVDMVVGTSFGAILGALYCSGYTPKEIRQIMTEVDFVGLLNEKSVSLEKIPPRSFSPQIDSYFSLSFSQSGIGATPGVLGDQNIITMLDDYLSRTMHIDDFDDLQIPFRAVTTDISNGKVVVIDSGSIVSAVRASLSLPLVWTPAPLDVNGGIYAFDGGMSNNLPIKVAKDLGADIIIAIDVLNETTSNAAAMTDLSSVVLQFIYLVIANSSSEQYEMADLILTPDLSKYNFMDFIHAKELIEAGQVCIEENREAFHEIAERLRESGAEISAKPYNRISEYAKLTDPVIESVEVKDVSFMPPVPLPNPEEFKQFVGKTLDENTKKLLTAKLNAMRDIYHLTSFSYYVKKGSSENSCILELQANHYSSDMSKIFFGGDNLLSIGKTADDDYTRFLPVPNLTAGFYLVRPIEILGKITLSNTSSADISVFPTLAVFDNGAKFQFDFGTSAKFGSLEPKSNLLYKNRIVAADNGFSTNAGVQFRYIDILNLRTGIGYEVDYLNSSKAITNLLDLYFDAIFNNLGNPFTGMSGIKMEVFGKFGANLNDFANAGDDFKPCYKITAGVTQKFEVLRDWISLGYDVHAGINRYPFSLNSGYFEYGGPGGMCGFSYGTLRRDFATTGLTYHQRITDIAGMPLAAIFQCKISASDTFNPFVENATPSETIFDGISGVDTGLGLYLSLKTPFGALVLGGSYNRKGQWCVSLGLN